MKELRDTVELSETPIKLSSADLECLGDLVSGGGFFIEILLDRLHNVLQVLVPHHHPPVRHLSGCVAHRHSQDPSGGSGEER